jgi:hypothetical protein
VVSTADNAKTTYEALAPIGNAASQSLPNSNALKIIKFPEIPSAVGYGLNAVQLGVKCYEGAQKDGAAGCATEAGKEAFLTGVQTAGTTVGTCLAAETGPFAPAIGAATGLCARAAAEYALDHPAVLKPLEHAFDCDPFGNCTPNPDLQAPQNDTAADDPTRQSLENQFDQTSAQNDAAAQAQQEAAAANATSSSSDSTSGLLNGLLQGLDAAAMMNQAAHSQSTAPMPRAAAPTPTPAIPAGWVPCSCPDQHSGMGQYFGGSLYHPPGPKCR